MKAKLGIYFESECGRVEADRGLVAVLDVEHWLESQHLPVGARRVADNVCAALNEYPVLVQQIMEKYHAALASADQQERALLVQAPGLSD